MINYVNNAYDKVLKPCDAQRFSEIINSQETERLILTHRAGDEKAKSKLPALTYMGVFDKTKWPPSNPPKGGGTRKAEFMRPTGLLMLDFDHVEAPQALYEQLAAKMDKAKLALAHITPSGQGLRLVLQREKGKTIEQEQYEFCKAMGVKCDDVCKDISRLSFAPMQKEILYFNPSLLFAELPNAEDYPDGSIFGGAQTPSNLPLYGEALQTSRTTIQENTPEALPIEGEMPEGQRGSWGDLFNGIPYADIVRRLEEQLGGRPERGARNAFIFTMACNLRYICNDDADWVASILPTYGEEPQKHRMTIQSAINRPMSRTMPETMARALSVAKMCSDADPQPSTLNPQL